MKSRRAPLLLIVGGVLLAALALWLTDAFEPRYDGLPARTYLLGLLNQTRFGGKEYREKVLVVPAHVAVPILARCADTQDPRWLGWYQRIYPLLPRIISKKMAPPKSNEGQAIRAVMALGYYGPEARLAMPHLLKAVRTTASSPMRRTVFTAFGNMGPTASNAIPVLIYHVQSGSTEAGAAALVLGQIDARGKRSGTVLVAALSRPGSAVPAFTALGQMASNDVRWIPAIWNAVKISRTPQAIYEGVFQLLKCHALDEDRVRLLLARCLDATEPLNCRGAILTSIGPCTEHAGFLVPAMTLLCAESNANLRVPAHQALLQCALATNVAMALRVAALQTTLSSGDDMCKWTSLNAVKSQGELSHSLALPVLGLLSDKNERIRAKATEVVPLLGLPIQESEPALRALLDDSWEIVRAGAASALRQIHSRPPLP